MPGLIGVVIRWQPELCQRTGFFDQCSFRYIFFTAAGQTVTIDTSSASCYDMDWTGATNNPTFSHGSSSSLHTYGILTFISAMTVSYIGIVDYGPQISSGTNLYDLTSENPLTLESPLTLNELIINSSFNANGYSLN